MENNTEAQHTTETESPQKISTPVVEKKRRVTNYLNNKDLLAQVVLSQSTGKMSNELVKMLTLLTEKYSTKGNLSGYSYIEDMRSHAMLNLVTAWKKFNPAKSSNPFAFFTECIKNSFNQYLNYEDKESTIKNELLITCGMDPSYNYGADEAFKRGYDADFELMKGARVKPTTNEE